MFGGKENKRGLKMCKRWRLQNILHTWVSPAVLVRCVLRQPGSSRLPLLSEGAAPPPLSPNWTTTTTLSPAAH